MTSGTIEKVKKMKNGELRRCVPKCKWLGNDVNKSPKVVASQQCYQPLVVRKSPQ